LKRQGGRARLQYAPPVFSKAISIRWRDVDAFGHVNNAVYLTYLEELLTECLRPLLGDDWVTVRAELNFRSELLLAHAGVQVEARVDRIGNSSVTFAVGIRRPDGVIAADGQVVVVAWTPETRQSRPLSQDEREAFAAGT
jgi:acyl-CoA thioester hydrolase